MRDAFGGTFMIQIFLVFIMIYICFTAMALNYAKAFKVKNAVIDYLENNETILTEDLPAAITDKLDTYFASEILGHMKYNLSSQNICGVSGDNSIPITDTDTGEVIGYCHNSGVKIEIAGNGENTEGIYYTVSTYIGWSMPFLNGLLALGGNNQQREVPIGMWKISGQTRLIVNE